ncbi:helix-turn-helix domain-containing protein [Listeria welshimeri]|uniref:Helix-turn-helix domain-containing protein n=2 Tax=Listeria welshimeri TaxID=1643 RepID=A0A7X0T5T8_LISWE|nr:transposase [Listeria welshimeri]MBC1242884.1 helix-turn-helix domain-containing protein [Listeria welshimeri]MBC1250900.1 helix-turn-helix domain-containing protein [Listeria welshimeri]MBC1251377.1 helix-turn-helix domain-containing protein [Listeria welshimeri]MBC1282243.1 helix-turn-helix domain-containing protein [Listeria welshimeri]MBC1288611.1 helix-turn-helix domain-containing protein [Listeria welshimeri]
MPKKLYNEKFKRSLVYLYHHGTSKNKLCTDFGVSMASLARWIKSYNTENIDLNEASSILQMYELKKQKALLEEEISILSEAITLFNLETSVEN